MAIEIPIPNDRASFSENIIVGGLSTTIRLNFNSTDKKWRIDIYDNRGDVVLLGIALSPNKSPTKKYALEYLTNGNFWVLRKTNTDQPLKYDNFGFNQDYGLFFITSDEEEELGI